MSSVINTNVSSLNAQKNLATTQNQLSTALQRLSSGLRINSAKDDAAGLAISTRFTSQINGLNVAARNANDGISLTQTAEGAMNEVVNNLQRMRELAVQSLNASNSATDRAALDSEVQQLKSEVDRVAQSTSFNGVKLLDGTFQSQAFQVGANAGETISVASIASLRTTALGQGYGATQAGTTLAAATGITGAGQLTFTANSKTYDVYAGTNIGGDAQSLANAINSAGVPGLTATAAATNVTGGYTDSGAVTAGTATLTLNSKALALNITGVGTTDVANTISVINQNSAATGVSAVASGAGIKLNAVDGRNITLAYANGTATVATADDIGLGNGSGAVVAATSFGSYSLSYSGDSTLAALTIGGSAAANVKGVANGTLTPAQTGTQVAQLDVLTVANANTALASIDNALSTVSTARGAMGAYQNRFGSAIANLATAAENMSAARSRIQDADFAAETANLTRAQILQQAGTAMLSQANQLPQTVLSLLK
ncbi:MAG: flagellin [Burkholderiales bacterium]